MSHRQFRGNLEWMLGGRTKNDKFQTYARNFVQKPIFSVAAYTF